MIPFGITSVYQAGYHDGYDRGADRALDTMIVILDKQSKSDTTVTRLRLEGTDTVTFILSKKTILP